MSKNNHSDASYFSDELYNLPRFIKQMDADAASHDFRLN